MKQLLLLIVLLLHLQAQSNNQVASLEYRLTGHNNVIEKSSFSPDNKFIATGDWDGDIYLWSLQHGIKVALFSKHQEKITGLKFISKTILVSSSSDGLICIWDVQQKKLINQYSHTVSITAFDANKNMIVMVDKMSHVYAFDFKTKHKTFITKQIREITNISITFDQYIMMANSEKKIFISSMNGKIVRQFFVKNNITTMDLYLNYIVTGDASNQVKIWDKKRGELITSFRMERSIQKIHFVKSAKRLLIYSGSNIYLYSLLNKKFISILSQTFFYEVSHSPNWKYLAGLGNKKINIYRLASVPKNRLKYVHQNDLLKYVKNNLQKPYESKKPGILVMPLTNSNKKTTKIGSLIAMMAMFHSTYSPNKILNLPLEQIENFFHENNLYLAQQKIPIYAKERLGVKNIINGHLVFKENKYFINIVCSGELPTKTYQKSFFKLKNILIWLVRIIHKHVNIELNDTQKKYQNTQELLTGNDLQSISETFALYYKTSYTTPIYLWKNLASNYPDNTFIAFYYARSHSLDDISSIWHLIETLKKHKQHLYLQKMLASFYLKKKQGIKALRIYIQLIKKDAENPALYREMFQALQLEKEWDAQRIVLLYCRNYVDSYWYNVLAGEYYINHAWKILHSSNGQDKFTQKMKKAESFLQMAYGQNNKRWQAPSYMLKVCMGLKYDIKKMERWFKKATKYQKTQEAYWQKFNYLTPRWFGSKEKMLTFARSTVKMSGKSSLRFLLLNAHRELLPDDNYYQNKKVWKDITNVFEAYLIIFPRDRVRHIWYWEYAILAKQYDKAALIYVKMKMLGQLQSLLDSLAYKKANKESLYFALANIYIKQKNKNKAKIWLKKALHLSPRKWQYQKIYAQILQEEGKYNAAYEHLSVLKKNAPKWHNYAQKQMLNIKDKQSAPSKLSKTQNQTLFILVAQKKNKNMALIIKKMLKEKFKIQVEILPDIYKFNRHHYIADKRKKVEETLQRLYQVMGKQKVEGYRAVYALDKDTEGDWELLKNILSSTAKGKKALKDIDKNYMDRWNAKLITSTAQKKYIDIINKQKTLGIVIFTDEEIGTLEKGYRFAFVQKKVGILSLKRIKNTSRMLFQNRILKLAYYTTAGILNIKSTLPQCPASYAKDLPTLDLQNTKLSQEATDQLQKIYDSF